MNYLNSTVISLCLLTPACLGLSQTPNSDSGRSRLTWALVQGERLEISQDFKVRLDGRKLRVALERRGEISTDASEELVIALLQPAREPQKMIVKADQPIEFEDVQDGISSLLVLGADSALQTRLVTYAAFAFFAESPAADAPPALAAVPQPLEIPLATVSINRIRKELPAVSTAVNLEAIGSLDDYDQRPSNHFRVTRTAKGSIAGKVHIPQNQDAELPGRVRVTILRNDVVVAEITSQPDGRFEVPDIELGFFTLFAVGPSGHAAYSFEVVENPQGAGIPGPGRAAKNLFVNAQLGAASQLDVLLIPPSLMDQVVRLVVEQYGPLQAVESVELAGGGVEAAAIGAAAAAVASNSSNNQSSGGGGGGGGSGGGGGGGAAALAGVAGIAVAFGVTSNDDGAFNANISTPIAPRATVTPTVTRN